MKKLILIFMAVTSSSAMAEWVHMDSSQGINFYYESSSVRKIGKISKIWGLVDLTEPKESPFGPFLSAKTLFEFNCSELSHRTVHSIVFSSKMGSGQPVSNDTPSDPWTPVSPGSIAEGMMKAACRKNQPR